MSNVLDNNLVELFNNNGYKTSMINFYNNKFNYINYVLKYQYHNYHYITKILIYMKNIILIKLIIKF